jgi:hypothetical protein
LSAPPSITHCGRIDVGRDLHAAAARRLDEFDHFLHAPEVGLACHLDVEDVHRNLRAFADGDGLADAVAEALAVMPQVGGVAAAHCRRGRGERDELVERGEGVRRVDEAGRDAGRALPHRGRHEVLHLLQLAGRGRTVVVADDHLARRAEAHVRQEIDGDALLLEQAEVAGEVRPRLRGGGRRLRRNRARLADDLCGHALADLALRVAVGHERHVGMRVHVDEAGRDDAALRIDDAPGAACRRGGRRPV